MPSPPESTGRDGPQLVPPSDRSPSLVGQAGGPRDPGADATAPATTRVDVPVGRRVMVVSDLLLTPSATATSTAVGAELARALDTWDGPGVLVVAGNLFDLSGADDPAGVEQALAAHPQLGAALRR
ncbi:MAG TPA: hypothetical protein VEJ44_04515, partial [Acidimicrobiales bacterium]|nr:hypothetical protein [Acidimicrobiales bacterium]